MKNKIGVYICHCGSNISDYVDVEKVRETVEKEPGVMLAKTTMFACADSVQKEMVEDITENKLDSIVIASCSPKLHLYTFRNVAIRAGLNPYNYVQVNVREQSSWAHSDRPADATDKALRLILAGIARVKHSEALTPLIIPAENTVLVVGAGVAGLRAAVELADMGSTVYLIEKEHFAGGRIIQWNNLFSTNEKGQEIIRNLYKQVKEHRNITFFTGAEIISNMGSIGNFETTIRITPRFIKPNYSPEPLEIEKAIEVCPLETNDDYNFNITKRKAIYMNHPGQYPEKPVIDSELCNKCGECVKLSPGVDLEQQVETITIKSGAILLTTGFDPYEPGEGELGYREFNNVITFQQFQRLIELNEKELIFNHHKIKDIAYIYCIGSRQSEGENKYCSRYCCTAALHTANEVRKKYRDINNYHITRGIRTYGKQEIIYQEAINNGDLILQFTEGSPPEIEQHDHITMLKVTDILTDNSELHIAADLIVLITGMVPRKSNISDILKAPRGRDRFLNEVHPKLRPVETVIDGIFIAGSCQGPKNITESVQSALSAASKANGFISKGEIELEPIMARIDKTSCEWCDKCQEVCQYDAILKTDYKDKTVAAVNESNCKGCGMCLPVCPVNAIQLIGFSDVEIESMIEALIE